MKNVKENNKFDQELFEAILLLNNRQELENFIKDLCTPQEINSLAERWRVCRLLDQGKLSYREISESTGVSLATITRIARFLKYDQNQGYTNVLNKMKNTGL